MKELVSCPLCGLALENSVSPDFDTLNYDISCRRCGSFTLTFEASVDIRDRPWPLQAAARQACELGQPLLITNKNFEQFMRRHGDTDIIENRDKLLNYIARRCKRPGSTVSFDPQYDYPVIDAASSDELQWHIKGAIESGYIDKAGVHHSLTSKGWDYLHGTSDAGMILGTCFVAMSFSPDHCYIYDEGIEPAVRGAGYHPVLMRSVLTNEDVCHRMLVEIRKSQFVVADFTGRKPGVYFEAGFALGLGREVFWTTHESDIQQIHFDTNHYQYIVWSTPAQLLQGLHNKIVAVIGYNNTSVGRPS